jgi:hypothetical protein
MKSKMLIVLLSSAGLGSPSLAQWSCPTGTPVVTVAPPQIGVGDSSIFDIVFPGQTSTAFPVLLGCDVLADLDPTWPTGEFIDVYLLNPNSAGARVDCVCSGLYSVGDRVTRVDAQTSGGPPLGSLGTVITGDPSFSLPILVAWDGWSGHSGGAGTCPGAGTAPGNAWWVACNDISPAPGSGPAYVGRISATGECALGSTSLIINADDFGPRISPSGEVLTRWIPSVAVNNFCGNARIDARIERCIAPVVLNSPLFAPFQFGFPAVVTFTNTPLAAGDVTIDFQVNADINSSNEFVPLVLNGTELAQLSSSAQCAASAVSIVIPKDTYNAALGSLGSATFSATPPSSVGYCTGSLSFTVTYEAGAQTADIRVPSDYPTIQLAVDAAIDGQTIVVEPGQYGGFQVAGKSLTFIAAGSSAPVVIESSIAPSVSFGPGSSGSSLLGLTIQGASGVGGGVAVVGAEAIVLADCSIRSSGSGSGAAMRVADGGTVRMVRGSISDCISALSIVESTGAGSEALLEDVVVSRNRITGSTGGLIRANGGSAGAPEDRSLATLYSCDVRDNHCGRSVFEVGSSTSDAIEVRACAIERSNFLSSTARVFRVVSGDGTGSVFRDSAMCANHPAVSIDAAEQSGLSVSVACDCADQCDLQWASEVLGFSSQWSTGLWSAAQALGLPNTWQYGDISTAWAPCCTSGTHTITLGFPNPVRSEGCIVRETYSTPFVQEIVAIDVSGNELVVWAPGGTDSDQAVPGMPSNSYFTWSATQGLTRGLRISVASVGSWEEIDAVGLIGKISTVDCDGNGVLDSLDILANPSLDSDGNAVLDICDCRGDLNSDGHVDGVDLAIVLGAWSSTSSANADINGDGVVNGQDLAFVLAGWGACP